MSTSTNAISDKIATLEKALKSDITESLKKKLQDKLAKLKDDLNKASKGEEISAKDLADSLLKSRKKFIEMSSKDFDGVIKRLQTKPEYSFLKSYTRSQIIDDIKRKAKPVGWRFKGRNNYKIPSKEQVKNRRINGVYYENRPERSDVSQTRQLKHGGAIYTVNLLGQEDKPLTESMMTAKNLTELKKKVKEKYGTTKGFRVRKRSKSGAMHYVKFEDGGSTYAEGGEIKRGELNSYSDEKIAMIYSNMKGLDYSDVIIELKGNREEREDTINEILKGGSTYAEGGGVDTYKKMSHLDFGNIREGDKIKFKDKIGVVNEVSDRGVKYTMDNQPLFISWAMVDGSGFEVALSNLKKKGNKDYAKGGSTYAEGGEIIYNDREDFYEKNPNFPRRIEITKEQYIKNKDFISKQKWGRNIVDTQGYEDNNGVEFVEFDIEVGEKSSWDMWGWINENIPSSDRKIFVQDKKFLSYADGGSIQDNAPVIRYYFEDEEYEYAQGGMVEHGLQIGDKIVSKGIRTIKVENSGKQYVVNLQNGTREDS
tara:strand:- start:257 stop:1873 length:1617 start_codon:yes stop_codon:yes gene_type:complete